MDVKRPPELPSSAAATGGGSAAAPAGSSAHLAPPPRLPSISALLNDVDPAQDRNSAPTHSLPPCNSFDKPPRPPYTFSTTSLSPIASRSPPTPASQVSSSEFPPVATASPGTAEDAGSAASQAPKLDALPARQLTSVEFPDGNALHPLPSGLSSASAIAGARNASTGSTTDPSARPRSNSISYQPVYELPSFARLPHAGYQSFATSSERGNASSGGGGPPDERRSFSGAFESVDPFFRHPGLSGGGVVAGGASSPPGRPRALSISTTDEYRAWPADAPAHLRHFPGGGGLIPRSQADLASLRRGSAPAPRLAFVMEQPGGAPPPPPPLPAAAAPAAVDPATGLPYPPYPHPHPHHHRWSGPHHPHAPSALLPPPPPPGAHSTTPAGLGLVPLAIPSGLPLSSPVSPPTISPASAGPVSAAAAAGGGGGWGALPGRPGPPPSGQLAADLAYGVAVDAQQAGEGAASEVGRYICPHCTKRFARPSSLRIHMHSHTGEKPFSCHLCDRAFSVQSNLRRHLKIHKGGPSTTPSGPNGTRRGERIAREQQARAAAAEAEAAAGAAGGASGAVAAEEGEEGEEEEEGEGEGEGDGDEEMASTSDDGGGGGGGGG
ncbi:hypothetical protein JCM6882_008539 [Rhodosporidiobolus microsporus]